jgi:outer membrane cobalamin receptor
MNDYRHRLMATTLFVSAGLLATPALAQEAPVSDAPTGPVEGQPPAEMQAPSGEAAAPAEDVGKDIVVTGTRIPSANLQSVAPVTVVSGQDFKLSGTTRVEDLLNSLPSIGASQTSGMSNGASGTAEVDLRYLGSKRTLTLVNGRRLAPGDPASTTQAAKIM